ncbi:AAA family ATPase [Sneathiella sp.]|jgi:predicted ATPase/class 3 adenylate cyclase|uniref:AAA family ATPase n=1 Tax=Sneathiella sp. TaxID=1964365 RepID=UPI0039E60AB2
MNKNKNKNITTSETGSQRRHVTVLFSDLCHSTQLGALADPENTAEIVRSVKEAATKVISEFDGIVTQFHGDGILAIFGYPVPLENDVENAATAALALHKEINSLDLKDFLPEGFEAKLHTGIEAGLVLISDGNYLDGTLELVGDAVNVAAGISNAAADDEIIILDKTLGRARPFFNVSATAPVAVKGRTRPQPAWKIHSTTGISTRFEASKKRGLTAFHGREQELSLLQNYVSKAAFEGQQVVQIIGDPGLGKTRLLDEFSRQSGLANCTILRGHCESRGGIEPLQPFLQILRNHFNLSPSLSIGDEPKLDLPAPLEEGQPPALTEASLRTALSTRIEGDSLAQRARIFETFLDNLEERCTVVLIIDDWQWADDASRKLLNRLLRSTVKNRILFVLAARDQKVEDILLDVSSTIKLAPLSQKATAKLIAELLPEQGSISEKESLHTKSGGNPLFLEELCQSVYDWEAREQLAPNSGVIPATLQGLIEARVRRLPQDQIDLIHIASVIGNIIPLWLLERLSGIKNGDPILRDLARSDIIYSSGLRDALQFKHGITRETIYATVSLKQRRQIHGDVASILEQLAEAGNPDEYLESLAYHHAGSANFLKALEYAERAGDKALATSSLDRARLQYEAGLQAIKRLPQTHENRQKWISISSRWALPCVYGPEKEQLDILDKTIAFAEELEDLNGLANAYYWQGYISHVLGDQTASIHSFSKALNVATDVGNRQSATQITATLGQSHAAAADYKNALSLLDQAIHEKREHPGKSRVKVGTSYALSCKAMVLGDMGAFSQSDECSAQAHQNVAGQGHEIEGSILNNRATVCLWQGKWEQAVEFSDQSKQIAEHVSAPYLYACASAINAYGRWKLFKDPASINTLKQVLTLVEEKGMFLYSSFFYGWTADVLFSLGKKSDAQHYAEKALERADQQDSLGEAMACRTLASLSFQQGGDNSIADAYMHRAALSAQQRSSPHEQAKNLLLITENQLRTGKKSLAQKNAADAQILFAQMGIRIYDDQIASLINN